MSPDFLSGVVATVVVFAACGMVWLLVACVAEKEAENAIKAHLESHHKSSDNKKE